MPSGTSFRTTFVSLWLRMVSLCSVALVFAQGLALSQGQAQGWTFYLSARDVAFAVMVRLVTASLAGIALGTLLAALLAPVLGYFGGAREFVVNSATKVLVVLVLFLVSRYALQALIRSSYQFANHGALLDKALLAAHFLGFVVLLVIPRSRKELVTSLDGFLGETMTRRAAVVTVFGAAAVVATEYVLRRSLPARQALATSRRPALNLLLVTFDAMAAEDMSLYGYRLPTTPHIDAFARQASVFTRYYSGSTFTTPCIATILSGQYLSENHVYQLHGPFRGSSALPGALRQAGIATGAVLSNPYAYFLAGDIKNEFDALPQPDFQRGGFQYLWKGTAPLHQNSGVGSVVDQYVDMATNWDYIRRLPDNSHERFRPHESFELARQTLAELPEGFFLWVHVMAPHAPYLPDAREFGKFLDPSIRVPDLSEVKDRADWRPHYKANRQKEVEQHRLRYNEYIATADRAFGEFMADLQAGGRLDNTTVVVSADHGESFEGGVYQHGGPDMTRPVIHVPLIVRRAGQQEGRTIAVTADQTSLAPTILELAGASRPASMRSPSLVPLLDQSQTAGDEGRAFCQYFERNSVFRPIQHGTVGVVDRQFQYVVTIDSQKGALRPLSEAQDFRIDRSAAYPADAEALRNSLHERFPDLVRQTV